MPSLSLGLGLHKNRIFAAGGGGAPFSPTDLSGLSLWLKADAGITSTDSSYNYKSNIALSSAGQTTINGDYTPSSVPPSNSNYILFGSNNNQIEVRPNSSPIYRLYNTDNYIDGQTLYYDFTSTNGTTWSFGDGKRPVSITISGLTGASAIANGTYGSFVGTNDGGVYWIAYNSTELGALKVYQNGTCELFAFISSTLTLVATGSNWGIGSFAIVSPATGSPTGSGTIYPTGGVPTGLVTTTTVNLSNVTAWADQSGNGRDASPVDVSPTLNSSDLNSKPTISLSSVAGGTNKSLQISGNPMGAIGATAFVVNYVDPAVFAVDGEGGDANGALLGNFGSASDGSHWPYGFTNSVYDSFATDTRKDDLGLPTGITDWNIYSVYSQDNDWKLFCNGTEFYSDASNVYSNSIANSTSLYIGMQNNAGTDEIFKGKIAEVVFYNRVLTTQERQQVEAYLNTKYAIY
jgi:hypothetical protein